MADNMAGGRRRLTGWGRSTHTGAEVVTPALPTEIADVLRTTGGRGAIARGLGRSYGDAAQNAGGTVLETTQLATVRSHDLEAGTITVSAGTSLDQLMRLFVPRGWFPAVTPGTRHVTVGGAIAADIHGKNHHVDGTFMRHVTGLQLATPIGVHWVHPENDFELFWATAGGMGLTGIVVEAELQLRPITTSKMSVDTERCHDLDDVLSRMDSSDDSYDYSVAWIDLLASGSKLGRSVLTRGHHAELEQLSSIQRLAPLAFDPSVIATAPLWVPRAVLNRATVGLFNELWFRRAPIQRRAELQTIAQFFHPLDAVSGWNRIYGRHGFLQYQFVVPFGAESTLRHIIEAISRTGLASFLAVLKRFGARNDGHLSFPIPGWTLALDIPIGDDRLPGLLDEFDHAVAAAGGRVYLAKDSRMRPELVEHMYPRLHEWRKIRDTVDPDRRLNSDLARRLRLLRER